ncbi:MAG: relaxase/mobilization nuclease domain-containing protein [Clostridia bacterium]|nr:relaxase/mobilization nuclease domain-containing protein [Clostridia bacterium]
MPLFKCSASKAKSKNGITYITDPKKAKIVSVRNLFEDEDYAKQFEETASRFGKGDKFDERKYYHCKLSCARQDNVSPEKAHAYAEELTAKLFQNYECVIATHTDTKTVHSHIIVNAVDPITGKKLQFSKKDYVNMKDEANRLGKKYGFTETNFRKRGKNSRTATERKILLKGGVSWKEELREVIAEAIKKSTTPEKFREYLEKCYGVKITRDGKDYSYLHPEKQKAIRGERLGMDYMKREVIRKIDEHNNRRTSTAYNGGRRSGFVGQRTGGGSVRGGKTFNGGSPGIVVNASLNGIQREMQRLDYEAQCSGRGTDAASQERRMEQRRLREQAERGRREALERSAREQLQSVEKDRGNAEQDNDNGNGDREPHKYSYGKGD